MRALAISLLVLAACNERKPSATAPTSSAAPSLAPIPPPVPVEIGPEGGRVEQAGAVLIIPKGALAAKQSFSIRKATDLRDWPRGTVAGYVLTAPQAFRFVATLLFPHPDGEGEIMCTVHGTRQHEHFDPSPHDKPLSFHVGELPEKCAVYSPEHAAARREAAEKEEAVAEEQNVKHRWDVKGTQCDPHQLVRPNAGKDLREPPGIGGCPPGMTPVKNACIDRWEAHLVEILDDGTEHTWSPYFNPGELRVRAKSAPGAIPQGYISMPQAEAACKEAGKRLCHDDEWLAACHGPKKLLYPYGNEEKLGTCNDHRDKHPAMEYLEKSDRSIFKELEHPCINQLPDSLLPTGAKKGCVTTDGELDMVGNLHEWTDDPKGSFRGGYYVDTKLNGRGCDYVTTAHESGYWDYSTGFRCCADLKSK